MMHFGELQSQLINEGIMVDITEYLFPNSDTVEGHPKHNDYIDCPAKAFLDFCVTAKDSIEHCKEKFDNNGDPSRLTKPSNIKIQSLINSTLALIMGHFETYQKYLFAGLFERSIYLKDFNKNKDFFKKCNGDKSGETIQINSIHLLGYRGESAVAGVLLADMLKGWHDPERVNKHLRAFGFETAFFSNKDIEVLQCLWQIRHSIVHTAATLTKPDAQKVEKLNAFSGKNIIFKNNFIYELVKFLHEVVKEGNTKIEETFLKNIKDNCSENERNDIRNFLRVESRNPYLLDRNSNFQNSIF